MALSLLTKQLLLLFLVVWAGLVIYLFAVHREQVVKEERRQKVRLLERHSLTPGSARPCGACEGAGAAGAGAGAAGAADLRAVFTDWPRVAWRALEAKALEAVSSASLAVESFPLFSLLPASEKEACGLQAVSHDAAWLRLELSCSNGILAVFSAQLREDAHYIRFKVRILSGPGWPAAGFRELQLWKLHGSSHIQETKHPRESEEDFEDISGLPVIVNKRFFVAVEHPMAETSASKRSGSQYVNLTGQIAHLKSLARPTEEAPWEYGFVIGTFQEPSQARRAFLSYLERERPGRRTPMVHYNSWYDFYSYQDEGFNGGFKDPWPNETLISSLRPDKMSEGRCIQRIDAFGEEMVLKRHTKLDSFLWDDGWDDPHTLWEFDKERFPQRFEKVAAKAQEYSAGTGVWLSPWGGYGFTQEARVKYGKQQGYETNYNKNIQSEAFSLAGRKYQRAFHETAMSFRRSGVNMFKFDGVAGNPTELGMEMEAMLRTIAALRDKKGEGGEDEDDVWINLTTGTWPSPFFLLWADSIWRGGPDIATRPKDWYGPLTPQQRLALSAGRFVAPDLRELGADGLTGRQRWIRWRAMVVYILVVRRSVWFPLSQLMIHGVIVASHGDALHWGLDKFDPVDFAQEVWSFVGMGLQLQELYVAPRHMTSAAWDILAEGLRWSRQHAAVLRDSRWAFGDVSRKEVYCIASWGVPSARGFLFLHNPNGHAMTSESFTLEEVLELPQRQRGLSFQVSLVKSAFREGGRRKKERLPGWNCTAMFYEDTDASCKLQGTTLVSVTLEPTEVLVLSVAA